MTVPTISDLLKQYTTVLRELKRRKAVRSMNNPVADYAELLFCTAFGWTRHESNFSKSDALAPDCCYQIKSRRITPENPSCQSGIVHGPREEDPDEKPPFTHFAGVVFNEDFVIVRAFIMDYETYKDHRDYNDRNKGWFVVMDANLLTDPRVQDVSGMLIKAAADVDGTH